jgi:hypothetical protein
VEMRHEEDAKVRCLFGASYWTTHIQHIHPWLPTGLNKTNMLIRASLLDQICPTCSSVAPY